jgi:flagellum-specific peptidoglycan hydrolase FlgJ
MSKNQEYALQYADYAMAQMRRYGIPASVTLAQGILESSNGQSRLARNENNHFGIKATPSWIAGGGRYGTYTDDKPNEKFCSYDSVGDSYEHHSRFLKENSRYAGCFKLSPDDTAVQPPLTGVMGQLPQVLVTPSAHTRQLPNGISIGIF